MELENFKEWYDNLSGKEWEQLRYKPEVIINYKDNLYDKQQEMSMRMTLGEERFNLYMNCKKN